MASEFRKDIVSGEWLLVAGGLKKKPNFFAVKKAKPAPKKNCPFENLSSEFVTVIPNKFPILTPHKICPMPIAEGPYQKMGGIGFQEVLITRDHNRSLGFMTQREIQLVIEAYLQRYSALKAEKCIEYILIFHNHKKCVHCVLLKKEFKDKKRIIFKNDLFVAISPSASHVSFETRIYPLR